MNSATLRFGVTLYVIGGLIACGGNGCGCEQAPEAEETVADSKTRAEAQDKPAQLTPKPPPIDEYKEEALPIEDEFADYTAGILRCHEVGKGCAREAKAGRKMARRALRERRQGRKKRLHDLWRLSTSRLASESLGKLRLELTNVLKIAFVGALEFKERLLELLENESHPTAAKNLGGLLVGTLGDEDSALKDRLEHYLRRLEPKKKGLVDGQIGSWEAMEGLVKSEERWSKVALECLEKTSDGRLQTVLTRMLSNARAESKSDTSKVLSRVLKRSRSASQLSLASASVETLGKLGQPGAIDDIDHAIKTRYHQRSFLPSAALALFHLASQDGAEADGARIITSAKRILEIPGLSLVAYRYALYAIRDSGQPEASATLKSYAKHSNKEARKIAVKALLGVGKANPSSR